MTAEVTKVESMHDPDPSVRALVMRVAAVAGKHADEIVSLLVDEAVNEVEEIKADQRLLELATAGAQAAVVTNLQMLEHDLDVSSMEVPGAVVEYARVVAQRGFPFDLLERGTRVTRNVMLRWCLERLGELGDDPVVVARSAVDLMTRLTTWTDDLYRQVLHHYEIARETWLRERTAARTALIEAILAGRSVDVGDVERAFYYRLNQLHVGVIAWIDRSTSEDRLARLESAVSVLAKRCGAQSRPLFEPRDERTAWAWLPLGADAGVDLFEIASTFDGGDDSVTMAIGAMHEGAEGFVRTHRQATRAAMVARASQVPNLRVVFSESAGSVALMCSDLALASEWVRDVLGPLAVDDPPMAQYRETLRTFLASGGSYATTAVILTMHKNSVMYRLRKIEQLLGRSVRERRLDVENALALCEWLGSAVMEQSVRSD